jgi:hypothetical protein
LVRLELRVVEIFFQIPRLDSISALAGPDPPARELARATKLVNGRLGECKPDADLLDSEKRGGVDHSR